MVKYNYSHHIVEVFKYKNIYLGFFCLVLSLISAFDNASPTVASPTVGKTISNTVEVGSTTKVRAAISEQFPPAPELEYRHKSIQAIAAPESESAEANLKLVRRISLACFLLLFIPLGIFYPLFLFYRRLLNYDYDRSYSEDDRSKFPDPANSAEDYTLSSRLRQEESELSFATQVRGVNSDNPQNNSSTANSSSKKPRAKTADVAASASINTVSKLQIAFSPQAGRLRAKLSQVASCDCRSQLIELLRKTISVLLAQQYWTHISYSSDSLPGAKVGVEFDLVSHLERNKCLTRELSSINRQHHTSSFSSSHGSYNYVVVTLILCTTHDSPLFDKIYTKAQLIEELVKLSQIKNDRLLKFELLWNPQPEAEYISNEQLLTQYSDLTRLI